MKRVLLASGNGIATSTVESNKLRKACETHGVPVTVSKCKLLEVGNRDEE